MKRILMLNYEFPPLGGGGGVAAKVLAEGFIENGYQVDYLTSGFEGLAPFEVVDGINVYRVPVLGRTGLQTATMISLLSYPLAALMTGIRLCRAHRYEFINTQFVVPTGPLGYILSQLFKLPNILSLHGGDIYDPAKKSSPHRHWFLRVAVRFLLNAADRVIAQSSNTRDNAIRFYQPSKEIEIIPLPYEPATFAPATRAELGLPEGKRLIISVGRLVARKDLATLLRALALLPGDVALVIVGDGPERESLDTLANGLGISSRVHMPGSVSHEKKFQYLSNADVYALSSLHEGFGIVIQEAMQVGLPVVATNEGGQVDLIKEGVNGYLVPVGDETAFAAAILRLLDGKPLLGLTDQLEAFDPRVIAERYSMLK
ncbi:MAG: glycosyltransferase family 4 protein [Patescibacteria group bacterium]